VLRAIRVDRLRRWARSPKGLFTGILALLTLLAAPQAGWQRVGPLLLVAMGSAALLDAPLNRQRDKRWTFPDGGLLTGWLIGMILSPHESLLAAAGASVLGIGAKHLLRVGRANVLNPAAAGLVASALLLQTGQSWWGALPDQSLPAFAVLLGTTTFMAWRLGKVPLLLAFLLTHFTLATGSAWFGEPRQVAELFRSPDLQMAVFFAGFMATDPPTSPPRHRDQLGYAIIAALGGWLVFRWTGSVVFLLAGLLAANLWEGERKRRRG
jgi:Na+-translocating ferredoxin:NAD+ oxidoreductase RnfD subunit